MLVAPAVAGIAAGLVAGASVASAKRDNDPLISAQKCTDSGGQVINLGPDFRSGPTSPAGERISVDQAVLMLCCSPRCAARWGVAATRWLRPRRP